MKKRLIATIVTLALLISLCSTAVFGFANNSESQSFNAANQPDRKEQAISAEKMTETLEEFLGVTKENPSGNRGNRTYFSDSEKAMADYLESYANGFVKNEQPVYLVERQDFKLETYQSQNIIARKSGVSGGGEKKQQVVIVAQYDNSFGTREDKIGSDSTGALDNATGAATVMALMDYYKDVETPFDMVFGFFGAGSYNSLGAYRYIKEKMTNSEKNSTLLAVNIKRLGGDYMYMYSDEVKTEHNAYMYSKASELGYDFKAVPNNLPQLSVKYVESLPYANWAMLGEQAHFMSEGINALNIYSGNHNTLNLGDLESKEHPNVSGTKNDNYSNLKTLYPNYNKQMATAADLVINALSSSDFVSAMVRSKENRPSYKVLVNTLIAPLVTIGIIILLMVLVIILVKVLEKKYPFVPKIKKLKVAVFGMDYEKSGENDIFIDIKKDPTPGRPNNPFDGY